MSKILFFVLPITGPMYTSLRFAKTLRARGHQVIFAGMADCEPMVEPYGFPFVPMFTDWFPRGYVRGWIGGPTSRSWPDALRFLLDQRRVMIEHERYVEHLIRGGHREFTRQVSELAPDLILLDYDLHAYWAVMASQTRIKAAYFSPVLPMVEDPVTPPVNTLLRPARDLRSGLAVRWAWQRIFARRWLQNRALGLAGVPDPIGHIRELARACGYPLERLNTRSLLMPTLELPMIVACPAEFDFPEARGRPDVHYGDAAIDVDRDEPAFPWAELDGAKQLVYCSLGSVAFSQHFFQHVIDAVAREPRWQLVMNIGPSLSRSDFARVPTNAILVNGAPQLGLLRRAAVMITHAGFGSVRECIHFGVPQVAFPIGFDQPGVAARVEHHRLGVAGSFRDASADAVHASLSRVMQDEGFRTRSRAMQEIFRARDREQAGAVILERLLGSRPT
jgi:zeaxanthin glucosyltransferase